MRGRQFVAWMILVAFILLMCSACHSAEDAVKDTTGEAQTTDAADVSGSAGETEKEGTEPDTATQETEPDKPVSAQTFMLSGEIPFTVSDSAVYTEEMILEAAEKVLKEFGAGVISIDYDEGENEALVREFRQRVFPDGYELPDNGVIVLSSQVKVSLAERIFQQYFYNHYDEIFDVDPSLKAAVVSYLQAKFYEYNEDYTESANGVTISDQARTEGQIWMKKFKAFEQSVTDKFSGVTSQPTIVWVTELDGNWLVSVREWIRIQYGRSNEMGVGEPRLLVLRPTENGYELLHDYAREWFPDSALEGLEAYLSGDGIAGKIMLLTYDEEQKTWQREWQTIDRE